MYALYWIGDALLKQREREWREAREQKRLASRPADDELLDAKTAAGLLGLGPNAIYRLAARDEIAVEGWPIKVRRSELEAYVKRSRVRPGELGPTLNQYRRPEFGS